MSLGGMEKRFHSFLSSPLSAVTQEPQEPFPSQPQGMQSWASISVSRLPAFGVCGDDPLFRPGGHQWLGRLGGWVPFSCTSALRF